MFKVNNKDIYRAWMWTQKFKSFMLSFISSVVLGYHEVFQNVTTNSRKVSNVTEYSLKKRFP